MGITILIDLLKKFWLPITIILVVATAYFYVHHLQSKITDLTSQRDVAVAERNVAIANYNTIHSSLDAVNTTLDTLSKNAAATQKSFNSLTTSVTKQSSAVAGKLDLILKEKKPVTCEQAIQYLRDAVKEYNQ